MKENYTDITFLLDRSGSMLSIRAQAISAFNEFLKDQQEAPGEATFTLITFNHDFFFDKIQRPIKEVEPLTLERYQPDGNTAYWDALSRAMEMTGARLEKMAEAERPSRVVFVIYTDGEENSSKEIRPQTVHLLRARVEHQQQVYNWQFMFLGAGIDAVAAAAQIGIPQAQALNVATGGQGLNAAVRSASKNLRSYRGGQSTSYSVSSADREEQEKLMREQWKKK